MAGCTARRSLPRYSGGPSRARSAGPSPPAARPSPDPFLPARWPAQSAERQPAHHVPAAPAGAVRQDRCRRRRPPAQFARIDVVADPQSRHCGLPSTNHKICFLRIMKPRLAQPSSRVNSYSGRYKFCPRCGATTIRECLNCHTPIRGEYYFEGNLATPKVFTTKLLP